MTQKLKPGLERNFKPVLTHSVQMINRAVVMRTMILHLQCLQSLKTSLPLRAKVTKKPKSHVLEAAEILVLPCLVLSLGPPLRSKKRTRPRSHHAQCRRSQEVRCRRRPLGLVLTANLCAREPPRRGSSSRDLIVELRVRTLPGRCFLPLLPIAASQCVPGDECQPGSCPPGPGMIANPSVRVPLQRRRLTSLGRETLPTSPCTPALPRRPQRRGWSTGPAVPRSVPSPCVPAPSPCAPQRRGWPTGPAAPRTAPSPWGARASPAGRASAHR
mmetsp:Transcript_9140/g.27459  ORF Transcript_9140/g.27459 Transcript_9140/m.27459 type:complete len:272 (+) Transcript_9140:1469-2284(+)